MTQTALDMDDQEFAEFPEIDEGEESEEDEFDGPKIPYYNSYPTSK
jgi:hypothetical protein